jgi:hypothetical protein
MIDTNEFIEILDTLLVGVRDGALASGDVAALSERLITLYREAAEKAWMYDELCD